MMRKQRCPYCHKWFLPNPRTLRYEPTSGKYHSTQKACNRLQCRRERKRCADRDWRERNRDWFKGRHEKIRKWAKEYPGYWKRYRAAHAGYTHKNRVKSRLRMRQKRKMFAKQDAISANPVGYLDGIRHLGQEKMFAKQDAIGLQIDGIVAFLMTREMFAKPNDIVLNSSDTLK